MRNRRTFITLLGGAAAWPVAARAQATTMVGLLSSVSRDLSADRVSEFRQGLGVAGYDEGRNVTIEYRWADGHNDRLPGMAAELVRSRVTVIAAFSDSAALAAQAASRTIPIVFAIGNDPVKHGLVASLNRPGANITGVTNLNIELGPKRLELLHELVPSASTVALLINPVASNAASTLGDLPPLARRLGLDMPVLRASTDSDLANAFLSLSELNAGALLISGDNFFNSRSERLGNLSLQHSIPSIFQNREFAVGGGLMSYAANAAEMYRRVGVLVGRVLNGEKPNNLPVEQATKFDFVVNLKTAKALGLQVPPALLARADEVIE